MSTRIEKWLDNRYVQNIAVWCFVILIISMSIQAENKLLTAVIVVTFLTIPVYINNLKIIPLFNKKNKLMGVVLFFFNTLVFSVLAVCLIYLETEEFKWQMVYNLFSIMTLALLFSSAIKIAKDSFVRRQEIKDAELKLLKAQLNPHFLFNTLNNLYGLSVVSSNKLPELMLKLSDLLRYSLYDTKEQLVPLEKEIKYIQNYVSLESIRLEDKTDIKLNISQNIPAFHIAPMLLIVFVENAFKHLGVTKNEKSMVFIDIQIRDSELQFSCVNTTTKGYVNMEKGKSGIGLSNAKKRLSLIYPNRHTLKVEDKEEEYSVDLTLKL